MKSPFQVILITINSRKGYKSGGRVSCLKTGFLLVNKDYLFPFTLWLRRGTAELNELRIDNSLSIIASSCGIIIIMGRNLRLIWLHKHVSNSIYSSPLTRLARETWMIVYIVSKLVLPVIRVFPVDLFAVRLRSPAIDVCK